MDQHSLNYWKANFYSWSVGDQQSASIGQCCFEPGSLKSTYGTGAFVLLNTGSKIIYSKNRLAHYYAYRIKGKTTYAMEGSIFIAGAGVQWLRDKLNFFKKASETENIVKSLKDNKGSIFSSSIHRIRSSLLGCKC